MTQNENATQISIRGRKIPALLIAFLAAGSISAIQYDKVDLKEQALNVLIEETRLDMAHDNAIADLAAAPALDAHLAVVSLENIEEDLGEDTVVSDSSGRNIASSDTEMEQRVEALLVTLDAERKAQEANLEDPVLESPKVEREPNCISAKKPKHTKHSVQKRQFKSAPGKRFAKRTVKLTNKPKRMTLKF